MAGDWIKMRHALLQDPSVFSIGAEVGLDTFGVIGRLLAVWCWADTHTETGLVRGATCPQVDAVAQREGFAVAMQNAGWLRVSERGIEFPAFTRHNGNSAKRRGLDALRKRENRSAPRPRSVRKMSALQADEKRTRKEKNREELNTEIQNPPNPPTGGTRPEAVGTKPSRRKPVEMPAIPDDLRQSEAFVRTWNEWVSHRREKRQPLTPTAARNQLRNCAEWGVDRAIAALKHSTDSGYTGLFEPKDNGNARTSGNRTAPPAATDPRANSGRQPGGVAAKLTAMFADANAEVARIARESRAAV
jgi:hypothetical protein